MIPLFLSVIRVPGRPEGGGQGTSWPDSPDHSAVHGARCLGEDRAMMCGRESHGATAKGTWGRLARGIPLIPLNPGESRFRINLWLVTLFAPPTLSRRHARTCSGHPRVFQGPAGPTEGDIRNESGHDVGTPCKGETAAWMAGTSPAMTLVSPRAQGARCGNIGRALGSFSNRMLPRGIPLIPLNPGESRSTINDSWNPVSVSGCDASPPGHSLTPSCPDSFRASTALRRVWLMELAGYPDTRNESGQVRAGLSMKRELSAKVSGLMDARIPGTSPGKSGHDVGTPCVVGRPRGWPGQARP